MTTTRKSTRSLCVSRMLPAVAALTLALTAGDALASVQGRAAINAKLTPANIPTLKVNGDAATATQANLLLALALALEDPANSGLTAAEIAEGALELNALLKTRKDKDKVAGQIIATAVASRDLADDAVQLAAVTAAVFNVNGSNSNNTLKLTSAGQATALAGALKSADDASAGNSIGQSLAPVFIGDLALLLVNTSKALGTSTATASEALQNAVDGFFDQNEIPAANRQSFIKSTAEKIAKTNPEAAGALYGGLVLNNPNGSFTGNANLQSLAIDALGDPKLANAQAEIIASTMSFHTDKGALTQLLTAGKSDAVQSLIVEGLIRASTSTAEVQTVLDTFLVPGAVADLSKFAGIVAKGSGNDLNAIEKIVKEIAADKDVSTKTKIGLSVIVAIGRDTPNAAATVTKAIFDSDGASFADDASRTKFGTDNVAKIKSFAAAGYMASAIAERNIADSVNKANDAAQIAVDIMAKGPKAATDIAQQISALSSITDRVGFADLISDKNKKFVQNAAVGISITDPNNAEFITHKAITHDYALVGTKLIGDTAALGKAATIAGAVASAVDEEKAADIGLKLADAMSVNGTKTIDKPIKLSSATALATSLAKAIQAKPGVKTTNRMDELGEIAAAIVKNILGKNGTDAKALSTESKLISGLGTAILKTLSKTSLSDKRDLKADQTEARDIAGSIAQTIFAASTTDVPATQKNTLLGVLTGATHTQGSLEKAFLKYSGKKGTSDYLAVTQAFQDVLNGAGAGKYETGSVNDKETDTKNG